MRGRTIENYDWILFDSSAPHRSAIGPDCFDFEKETCGRRNDGPKVYSFLFRHDRFPARLFHSSTFPDSTARFSCEKGFGILKDII